MDSSLSCSINHVKGEGEDMLDNYEIISKDHDSLVMKTTQGNTVKICFCEKYNREVENLITNNLMMSYEARMKCLD